MEKRKLEMEFLNSLNKKYIINLDDPRFDLIPSEVQAAMEGIIAEDIFLVGEGNLQVPVEARIVTTTVDKLMD